MTEQRQFAERRYPLTLTHDGECQPIGGLTSDAQPSCTHSGSQNVLRGC